MCIRDSYSIAVIEESKFSELFDYCKTLETILLKVKYEIVFYENCEGGMDTQTYSVLKNGKWEEVVFDTLKDAVKVYETLEDTGNGYWTLQIERY
jgi:aminopeptidase-like protein